MTRGDKLLLCGLLLAAIAAAVALYGRNTFRGEKRAGQEAVISVAGKIVKTVRLKPSGGRQTLVLQGKAGACTVEIDGVRLRMREAPCPEQVCVNQGWIEHPGQTVVCLPGGIVLRIEGAAELDAVTR